MSNFSLKTDSDLPLWTSECIKVVTKLSARPCCTVSEANDHSLSLNAQIYRFHRWSPQTLKLSVICWLFYTECVTRLAPVSVNERQATRADVPFVDLLSSAWVHIASAMDCAPVQHNGRCIHSATQHALTRTRTQHTTHPVCNAPGSQNPLPRSLNRVWQ